MDFPFPPNLPVLTTMSPEGLGGDASPLQPVPSSSAVTTSANEARYTPLTVTSPFLAVTFFWCNGASVSGNVDVGLYTAGGTRLASTGSTAQAGTSTIQSVALSTSILLMPDLYYLAWCADNTSATMLVISYNDGAVDARRFGQFTQTSAFALPATATFAAASTSRTAVVGITSRTVI